MCCPMLLVRRPLHARVEPRMLTTVVLLQRACGKRRRREEGVTLNDGGRPGSFDNERKVNALLHHLGY